MALTRKDGIASVAALLVAAIATSLFLGYFDSIDARWAYGSLAIFGIVAISSAMTGVTAMMRNVWLRVTVYALSLGIFLITLVNSFANTSAWFIALLALIGVAWIEFVGVDFFSDGDGDSRMHKPTGLAT